MENCNSWRWGGEGLYSPHPQLFCMKRGAGHVAQQWPHRGKNLLAPMSLRDILQLHRSGLPVKQTQVSLSPPQPHKQHNTVREGGKNKEEISFGEGSKIHLMSSYLEKTTRIHFKLQNSNNHYGPAVSRITPKKSPDLRAHDCPAVLTKGVKITPGPTLSIPLALRNSSREEELKRSCSGQSNHHSSVSQTPRLSRGNPRNGHLSTFGVLI